MTQSTERNNKSVEETQREIKPFVPHLQIEKTRSSICPVGIDWISLCSIVHRDCVLESLLESAFYRRKSDGSRFRWYLKDEGEIQKEFFVSLVQKAHTRMVNGKRKDSLEWYLNVSFNPSHWMRGLGFGLQYRRYQRNQVAGNSHALKAALGELDGLIGGFEFFDLNGEVIRANGMKLQRGDVTRDARFNLRYEDLHSLQQENSREIIHERIDTAVIECLEIFQSIAPAYSRVASARHCYNGREYFIDDTNSDSQKSFKGYKEFEDYEENEKAYGDTIKAIRATGEWRINIYNKYLLGAKGSKIAEPSGQLRCEYQLLTAKQIEKKLGVCTAGQLVDELEKVSNWYDHHCVGEMPILEAAIEGVLSKMLSDSPQVQKAESLPRATKKLIELYHKLWYYADNADDIDLPEIKAGKILTEDEARYINNGVVMKQFSDIHKAVAEVIGYVPKRQQPKNVDGQKDINGQDKGKKDDIVNSRAVMEHPILAPLALEERDAQEAAQKKAEAEAERKLNTRYIAYKRLLNTLKVIRKFSETSSGRNWTEQRDIVRRKVLLKP